MVSFPGVNAEPPAEIIGHWRLLICRPPTRADAIKESDPVAFVLPQAIQRLRQ